MSQSPFRWPLAVSPFTLWDKLSIAKWLITSDRYTMGARVEELEAKFSEYSGAHALMVANGSLANQLVFELWKVKNPLAPKPLVIVPAVTWVSSITPALSAGMNIQFCDINLTDFSFDYEALEKILNEQAHRRIIIWPTALIGFSPDMHRLTEIAKKHGASLYLDSCENTFSRVPNHFSVFQNMDGSPTSSISILSSCDMTTTSGYMSHQVTSLEAGFVFFKNREDHDLGRMFRNHGMSRSLPPDHYLRRAIENGSPEVDPAFLFALPGTNLRNTDVHAVFGLRDFARIEASKAYREMIYDLFWKQLDRSLYYLPSKQDSHSAFCLPIFRGDKKIGFVKEALSNYGIEHRPIIGSNLLHQPIFRKYGKPEDFPNAEWLHQRGCYVGLHSGVTPAMVRELTDLLNWL